MFVRLIAMNDKHVPQAVAETELKRGAPIDGGAFIASVPKNYDGINAVIDPKMVASDTIAVGDIYNKEPTFVGERYATTEITGVDNLEAGDALTVANNKWAAGEGEWKYGGEFTAHNYGVKLYIVEKVAKVEQVAEDDQVTQD